MNPKIQKSVLVAFFLYILIGIYLSINTGISHDEFHEQYNWIINLNAIKTYISNGNYEELINYKDRYHGIGFHYISQPFQFFLDKKIATYLSITEYGGILVSKHILTFLIFVVSGLFLYLIFKQLIKDKYFVIISVAIYLLYPYLFGHAQFNPKDIPFLSIWIICTYFVIKIIKKLFYRKKIELKYFILFALFSSLLISIRTVGLLIYLQLIIFLFIFFENNNQRVIENIKYYKNNILITIGIIISLIYLLNPIFWHNPVEFINSIKWMGKYQQDVCTITLSKCVKALNLPSNYYFIWFFFKLPIAVIIGFFLFPLVEKKLSKNNFTKLIILSLIFTVVFTLILLILFNVAIYDEIRHIMFLIPLIFIISLSNIYLFNKKLFSIVGYVYIIFFIFENYSLNPYQYTWLNSFSKFYKIDKTFEVDYWGISGKNLNLKINNHANLNEIDKSICIYGGSFSKVFLNTKGFECFKSYSELDNANNRPFYVVQNVRNLKRSNPKDCILIGKESFNYTFFKQEVRSGNVWYCD